MTSKVVYSIFSILIDILNLAEQIAVYCIVVKNISDEFEQRRIFYVFLGLGSAGLFKPMLGLESLKTIYGMLMEIGEFVAYLHIYIRTDELNKVAGAFFALEIFLHIITFPIAIYIDSKGGCHCMKSVGAFCQIICSGIPYYVGINIAPTLHLFLDSSSPFRGTYYEILTILNLSLAMALVGYKIETMNPAAVWYDDLFSDKLATGWYALCLLCSIILGLITVITQVVFTSNILRDYENGITELKNYDKGIYIYTLVQAGLTLTGFAMTLCCLCCFLCLFICKKFQ